MEEKEKEHMDTRYETAKEIYASMGVDTDEAIRKLKAILFLCTAGRETM